MDKIKSAIAKVLKWFKSNFIPSKGESKKQIINKILMIICVVVFIISISWLTFFFAQKIRTQRLNSKLQDIYSSIEESSEVPVESEPEEPVILPQFEELLSLNKDVVGWIEIEDTQVNLPVMQSEDNAYYLYHDFDGIETKTGAIFADFRCSLFDDRSDNVVIYGHRTSDGTFFGSLLEYKKMDYLKENPIVNFDTLYEKDQYKIFACFLINTMEQHDDAPVFNYHNVHNFADESEFNYFYNEVTKRSYFDTGVDVEYGDELITLSTCSQEFYNARYVIVARKLREGESAEIDTSKVKENEDKYMPLIWYEVTKQKAPR